MAEGDLWAGLTFGDCVSPLSEQTDTVEIEIPEKITAVSFDKLVGKVFSKPPFSADSLLLCDGQPTFIEFKRWRIADEKIVPIDRWLEENLKNKALDTALLYRRALAARAAFAGKPVRLWFVISDNSKLQQMHALRRKAGLTAGLPLDFLNRFGDPDRYGNRLYFDEVRMFTAEEFAALVREQHRWTVPT